MRIVSDYHDYYDTVQASGQDQTLVYLRKRKEVELNRDGFPFPLLETTSVDGLMWRGRGGVGIEQFVVGFCGKVYPILRLSHEDRSEVTAALCFGLGDVDAFIERNFKRKEIEAYRSNPRRWRFSSVWNRGQRHAKFEEHFSSFVAKQSAFAEIFIANQCPIFVASASSGSARHSRRYKIVFNESLKELEFFRIVDTFTAYQEVQMYFGAMAQPNKPIPAISDKDMVSIKGFDKWSFRKPPKSNR